MRFFFIRPLQDLGLCLNHLADTPRPQRSMVVVVIALLLTWFIYVPIHELLHVAGCVATGGSVTELQIAPQYGGTLLARWFPFVVSGGDYAGRLSGFDTKGSDWIYLATVFGPFLLSVLFGVTIIRVCTRRWRPILFGSGIVVGLAPFYNLIGDYYEMGSIIVTRSLTFVAGESDGILFEGIRADDVFKLFSTLVTNPSQLGLKGAGQITAGILLAVTSEIVAVILAFATYALGSLVARLVLRHPDASPRPPGDGPAPSFRRGT